MSASQNKRKRNTGGSGFGTGSHKKGPESKKASVTGRVAGITVLVVAVLFFAALFFNSGYLKQNFAVLKIDGVKYTTTDFKFYYQNAYGQYYNAMTNSGFESMLPSQDEPLKSQIYDEETGETWADFFREMALEQIEADNKIYKEALAAGYQLPEDDKTTMESDIETLKQNVILSGVSSFKDYLKQLYGKGMTEEAYRRNAERSYIISSYTDYIKESFEYSAEDLEAYYTENKDNLDVYTYRYFLVSAGSFKDADYPDEESLNAAKGAAVAATVIQAEEYASRITDEQSFIDIAREYDPETNAEDDTTLKVYQGELLGSIYGPWMQEAARQNGDVTTVEFSNGCYVVYYIDRDDNHYPTVNMRQIVVSPETVDEADYAEETSDDAYNAAVEKAKQNAEDTANKINDEWTADGATEEKLTELTTTYAAEISADDSVEMTNVYKQQELPQTVLDWLFDTARKAGDHTLIYNETTGYHIVYFEGQDMLYSDYLSDTEKRDEDLQAWEDGLTGSEPQTTWLMKFTG